MGNQENGYTILLFSGSSNSYLAVVEVELELESELESETIFSGGVRVGVA